MREAAEKLIRENQLQQKAEQRRPSGQQAIEAQERLRQKAGDWDGGAEVRKWRDLVPHIIFSIMAEGKDYRQDETDPCGWQVTNVATINSARRCSLGGNGRCPGASGKIHPGR